MNTIYYLKSMVSPFPILTPIARPPWTKLGRKLESQCRKALLEFSLITNCRKIAIALSGGKDSLTLLYLLHAIQGNGFAPLEITAIHIYGEFSCGPKITLSFLEKICAQLHITLVIKEIQQDRQSLSCYSCSRKRRQLIFTTAKELGITTIAFGHHREDSIQTLLLNLLHKAEFAANLPKVPMQRYGITIIRPLIFAKEADIIAFATLYKFNRISCQCPIGQLSKRQDVKNLLLHLENLFPNTRKNLMQAALKYGSNKALTL